MLKHESGYRRLTQGRAKKTTTDKYFVMIIDGNRPAAISREAPCLLLL